MAPLLISILLTLSFSKVIFAEEFDANELPRGHTITLPRTVTTLAPFDNRIKLKATDLPQTIRLSLETPIGMPTTALKIAIYDPYATTVRYLEITNSHPLIYSFATLSTIKLLPAKSKHQSQAALTQSMMRLKISSDKPLGISR